jgi:hypothetical protein
LQFVFDTGAGRSVLDLRVARELGLPEGPAEAVKGVGSTSVAFPVAGFRGSLGGVNLPTTLLAMDLRPASRVLWRRIDGLVGADFLKTVVTRIDYRKSRLSFSSSAAITPGAKVVPLKFITDGVCVPVSVDGSEPGWVRLDTGCRDGLHWVQRKKDSTGSALTGTSLGLAWRPGIQSEVPARLGEVSLGRVRAVIHQREIFSREAGLLGNSCLSRYEVTIDPFGKRLLLRSLETAPLR